MQVVPREGSNVEEEGTSISEYHHGGIKDLGKHGVRSEGLSGRNMEAEFILEQNRTQYDIIE